MPSESLRRIESALQRFEAYLSDNDLGKMEHLTPIPIQEIHQAEEELGARLPEDYVEFVTKGRFAVDGNLLLLTPSESLRMMKSEVANFNPHAFGTSAEEVAAAEAEHEVRRRLYPFQYTSTFVHDLYCFNLEQTSELGCRIIHVYRDDTELAKWVPKSIGEPQEYSFTAHIESLVQAFMGECG